MPSSAEAHRELRASLLWVIYTSITCTAVLTAATFPKPDTVLAACALCFLRGQWSRHRPAGRPVAHTEKGERR